MVGVTCFGIIRSQATRRDSLFFLWAFTTARWTLGHLLPASFFTVPKPRRQFRGAMRHLLSTQPGGDLLLSFLFGDQSPPMSFSTIRLPGANGFFWISEFPDSGSELTTMTTTKRWMETRGTEGNERRLGVKRFHIRRALLGQCWIGRERLARGGRAFPFPEILARPFEAGFV